MSHAPSRIGEDFQSRRILQDTLEETTEQIVELYKAEVEKSRTIVAEADFKTNTSERMP